MNATPQIVGLFEGYGGLTMGVQAAVGGDLIAYAEVEPAACRVLAHRHPGVVNLGDVAAVDWSQVRRDVARQLILTGGFPCQDVSSAGLRKGMRPDTRSGLWEHMAYAVAQLRPDLVVIENVRGLTSADAACDVEPCPWCLGDGEGRPLRALGAVLGDLANLGYDARWCGLRAADVGAPHARYRIFIVARPAADAGHGVLEAQPGGVAGWSACGERRYPRADRRPGDRHYASAADAGGGELQRRGVGGVLAGPEATRVGEGPERERDRHAAWDGCATPQDADGAARGERRLPAPGEAAGGRAWADAGGREGTVSPVGVPVGQREPADGPRAAAAERCGVAADTSGLGRGEGRSESAGPVGGPDVAVGGDVSWGAYEPAIRRWEQLTGRVAPPPTMTGARGGQQLAPAFVEWMMGLPAGHVTGVPGVSRNEQLKMLGNGVVPQQAAAALTYLLAADEPAA